MKKLFAVAALAALGSMSAFAGEWTGYISDAKCKHADGTEKSIACAQKCMKASGEAVLVTGDSVIKIDKASNAKITPHLGHKVTVTGTMEGDTLMVDTIKM